MRIEYVVLGCPKISCPQQQEDEQEEESSILGKETALQLTSLSHCFHTLKDMSLQHILIVGSRFSDLERLS